MRKSLLVAAALLLATPAISQAKSLEELLVEKGVISKAEAKGATGASGAKTWWNEGTRFEFPDNGFTASFATHLETRYTYFDNDQDVSTAEDTSSFDVTKARVIMSGTAMHNEFSYYMNVDFVGSGNENAVNTGSTNLLDGWIQWNACDWAAVRMGQFKTFVSRQFNTEDYKLQFPDRTLATQLFNAGRQAGVAGMGSFNDGMIQVNAGVFNGNSDGEGQNKPGADNNVAGAIGVRYNMGGIDASSESDVGHSEEFGLTAGAAYYYDGGEGQGAGERDFSLVSADVMMKVAGLSFAGEIYSLQIDPDSGDSVEPLGFYAQVGYFLMPKKFEIAARYGYIDCDSGGITCIQGTSVALDSVDEVGLALNYYFWAHHLKTSLAYTYIRINPVDSALEDADFNRLIFQVSGYF